MLPPSGAPADDVSRDVGIVDLDEVGLERLLPLLERSLGAAAVGRTAAFWRWKHEASPFGPSPGLVAVAGGEPVALRVFLRWRWDGPGGEVLAVRAVDTATRPDWQRRGLFRRLTLELVRRVEAEGTAFVFNTPNPRSRAGYLRMGWRDVGRAPLLVRVLRPARCLLGLLVSGWGEEAKALPPELRPVPELLAESGLDAFLSRWHRGARRLQTPRTREYLRWRYADPPGLVYGARWEISGGSGAVVVARARRRRRWSELSLSELMVTDDAGGREAARRLLGTIAGARSADYLAAVAAPETPERSAMIAAGFRRLERPAPRLTVRPLSGGPSRPDPALAASWRLSAGDLELF